MRKSILQEEKLCWCCLTTKNLELHHVFFGSANRKISDKHNFTVWLCHTHHTGSANSVHRDRALNLVLKKACQAKYEETHSREDFIKLIGRSYL